MTVSKPRKRKGTPEEQIIRDWCTKRRNEYRRFWLKDPKRVDVVLAARRAYVGPNKRQKWEFNCSACNGWFIRTFMQVDHTIPCGSFLSPDDEERFRHNLLNNPLTLMCKPCHKIKTAAERAKR